MSETEKKPSRVAKALLETADDMFRGGLLDQAVHDSIAMRNIGPNRFAKLDRSKRLRDGIDSLLDRPERDER